MRASQIATTLGACLCAAATVAIALMPSASDAQQRSQWPSEQFKERDDRNRDQSGGRNDRRSFGDEDQRGGRGRDVAGQFDYYALVLSWSPTYCSNATDRDRLQCDRQDGRRFSFVLHGLWPQYERGYPGECRTARRPFVPQPIIDSMLDIMPSPGLITHEYRKHGTCSGLDPQSYFLLSRQLFNRIRIPERLRNPFETQTIGIDELAREFMRANPNLKPEQFAISCAGGSSGRLKEMRFCFSKDGQPRACGDNENQRRMCSANRLFVPPVRSTARDDAFGDSRRPPAPNNDARRPLPGFKPLENGRGI